MQEVVGRACPDHASRGGGKPDRNCSKRESRAVELHPVTSRLLRTHRTRATSSRDETSFVTKSDGSSSSTWTSSSTSRIVPVRNMTGRNFVAGDFRRRLRTSRPSMPGIRMSRRTRSGLEDVIIPSASVPLVASMTSKFAPLREYRTKPLTAGSSSTTSIFCTVVLDIVASGPIPGTYKGEGPIASERILKGPGAWLSSAV